MKSRSTGDSVLTVSEHVNGGTMVYGVIGDPIAHSFSPQIHNTIAEALGHRLVYVPFHVKNGDLGAAIKGAEALNIRGLNITIPYKKAVMEFLCGLDVSAREVGSVNTLLLGDNGYTGYNTDCTGMYKSFVRMGVSIEGRSVIVLGAGGSAYAACIMAASHGASQLTIVNRTLANAENLAEHVKEYYNIPIHIQSFEEINSSEQKEKCLVIQTTSVGFGADAGISPVRREFFRDVDVALDIIYKPWETVFLRDAAEMGVRSVNGFDMLVYQAVAAYEVWRGVILEDEFVECVRKELAQSYMKPDSL